MVGGGLSLRSLGKSKMKVANIVVLSAAVLGFAGCMHFPSHSTDIGQIIQMWPKSEFYGIAVIALLGDDKPLSNGAIVDLSEEQATNVVVQFAIANSFAEDVRLKVSTRIDVTDSYPPTVTVSAISAAESAALVADRDSAYLWLRGTDGTGLRPPGFNSSGMTWGVELGGPFAVPKGETSRFRRILVLDFYVVAKGKHYLIEYPFECTFRRA